MTAGAPNPPPSPRRVRFLRRTTCAASGRRETLRVIGCPSGRAHRMGQPRTRGGAHRGHGAHQDSPDYAPASAALPGSVTAPSSCINPSASQLSNVSQMRSPANRMIEIPVADTCRPVAGSLSSGPRWVAAERPRPVALTVDDNPHLVVWLQRLFADAGVTPLTVENHTGSGREADSGVVSRCRFCNRPGPRADTRSRPSPANYTDL